MLHQHKKEKRIKTEHKNNEKNHEFPIPKEVLYMYHKDSPIYIQYKGYRKNIVDRKAAAKLK